MDTESSSAIKLLETLATCRSRLATHALHLQSHPAVASVRGALECRRYQTGSSVEGYVDAEQRNGNAICWWIEINWGDELWTVETSILINDAQGQNAIQKHKRTASTLDDLLLVLDSAVDLLLRVDIDRLL